VLLIALLIISISINVLTVSDILRKTTYITSIPGVTQIYPTNTPIITPTPSVNSKFYQKGLSNFVREITGPGSVDPVFVVRMKTIGDIKENDSFIEGKGFVPSDPEKTLIPFAVIGSNKLFGISYHTSGAFSDYAQTVETMPFTSVKKLVPPGTFIQLRVATGQLPRLMKQVAVMTLRSATKDTFGLPAMNIPAYSIEVIGQK